MVWVILIEVSLIFLDTAPQEPKAAAAIDTSIQESPLPPPNAAAVTTKTNAIFLPLDPNNQPLDQVSSTGDSGSSSGKIVLISIHDLIQPHCYHYHSRQ